MLVSSLPFCLLPTKRTRTAAPASLASSGPRGDRASTSRAPPPAGEDRRRPMAAAPAAHAYRASASVTTRPLHSASALRCAAPFPLPSSSSSSSQSTLLFASIEILRRVNNSCLRVLVSKKYIYIYPRFGHGCSVHRGVSQFR